MSIKCVIPGFEFQKYGSTGLNIYNSFDLLDNYFKESSSLFNKFFTQITLNIENDLINNTDDYSHYMIEASILELESDKKEFQEIFYSGYIATVHSIFEVNLSKILHCIGIKDDSSKSISFNAFKKLLHQKKKYEIDEEIEKEICFIRFVRNKLVHRKPLPNILFSLDNMDESKWEKGITYGQILTFYYERNDKCTFEYTKKCVEQNLLRYKGSEIWVVATDDFCIKTSNNLKCSLLKILSSLEEID